ncbi:MAG TPA: AAA family ATPase, partial [Chloroflexia bacterium]|nr:AAA family ATPase [Chloroflexia bacterium]
MTSELRVLRPPPDLVPRPRLLTRLGAGLTRKLVLVSAPAGYGKTTLLSTWVTSPDAPRAVGWIALDAADNDPARFWSRVATTLHEAQGGPSPSGGPAPPVPDPRCLPPAAVIEALARCTRPLVLILDDYQHITDAAIDAGLAYLLDHLPAEVHLVIASRCDPPLPLAAYRAAGELIEVRAADLRFTPEEVRACAGRFPHLAPAPEQFVARVARAEGWAAGLQMAALAMQAGDAAAPGAEPVITGKHKYIGDYLA